MVPRDHPDPPQARRRPGWSAISTSAPRPAMTGSEPPSRHAGTPHAGADADADADADAKTDDNWDEIQ